MQPQQTRITPPLRRTPLSQNSGHPPSSIPVMDRGPLVSMSSEPFDASTATLGWTSHPNDFRNVFLVPTWLGLAEPFPYRSRQRSSANAAHGGLESAPEGRSWRAASSLLHQLHSCATKNGDATTHLRFLRLRDTPVHALDHSGVGLQVCRYHGHQQRPDSAHSPW